MRRKLSIAIVIFIFIVGFCLFMYPTISNLWNEHLNGRMIDEYEEAVEEIGVSAREQMLEDARLYNEYKDNPEKLEELGLDYDELLNIYSNGVMGYIEIPKISESLVIYHHTEKDELQKGVGHIDTTSLPVGGEGTHCALAGHRGLPSASLLTNIDQLEIDDVFYIHVLDETLKYSVDDISVVLPDEVSKLRAEKGKDYVTLVTCTPYGINSHRLLVRGVRVQDEDDEDYEILHTPNELSDINPVYLVPIATVALVAIAAVAVRIRKRLRRKK
ncbi:MAG: class C sortase [Firmicutes bacterium]|nr:class C sortase [Bacillota bacterium]